MSRRVTRSLSVASTTSRRRRPGKLASCTVDFVSREFLFPTIQPTTSPRRRRGFLLSRLLHRRRARFFFPLISPIDS